MKHRNLASPGESLSHSKLMGFLQKLTMPLTWLVGCLWKVMNGLLDIRRSSRTNMFAWSVVVVGVAASFLVTASCDWADDGFDVHQCAHACIRNMTTDIDMVLIAVLTLMMATVPEMILLGALVPLALVIMLVDGWVPLHRCNADTSLAQRASENLAAHLVTLEGFVSSYVKDWTDVDVGSKVPPVPFNSDHYNDDEIDAILDS